MSARDLSDEKGVEGCARLCGPIVPTTQDAEAGQLQLQDLPGLYLLWLQNEFMASLGNLDKSNFIFDTQV